MNNVIRHAIGNLYYQHSSLNFIKNGVQPPYIARELDIEGHLIYLFFRSEKAFTLDVEQLNHLAAMLNTGDIDITLPDKIISVESGETALAFLEAFTNACKYGDRITISNHNYAPVITMTNNINLTKDVRSSGFGTKAFSNLIKKTTFANDLAYSVYITQI